MEYKKTKWTNDVTKLNESNMNNIEDGIEGAYNKLEDHQGRLNNVEDTTENIDLMFETDPSKIVMVVGTGSNKRVISTSIPDLERGLREDEVRQIVKEDIHVGDFTPTTQANTWLDTSVTLDMSEPSMAFEAPEEELAFEKVETELAFAEPTNENLSFSTDDPIDVTFEEVVDTLSFGTEPEELVFGDN